MSSTREKAERAAKEFFEAVLSPLGRRLRASGKVLADVTPRRISESYYEPSPSFNRKDFEIIGTVTPETLRAALQEQWKDDPSLQPLAGQLAELSTKIGVEVEQSEDVSPFVYVMV